MSDTIYVVNPNSTVAVTEAIDRACAPLRLAGGPRIECLTLAEGPPGIQTQRDVDGVVESPFTTWGNTLGWNVMPGAETWSAKEYKGFVYAGDMARGFDVYGFAECEGVSCIDLVPALCGVGSGDSDREVTVKLGERPAEIEDAAAPTVP